MCATTSSAATRAPRHWWPRSPTPEIWNLKRGGHDYRKVYAAYRAAMEHKGQPTVILAKTIKGYSLGAHFQGRKRHPPDEKTCAARPQDFRDAIRIRSPTSNWRRTRTCRRTTTPVRRRPEIRYLLDRRRALGGFVPERRNKARALTLPPRDVYRAAEEGFRPAACGHHDGDRAHLQGTVARQEYWRSDVPIIPDEARTFGMDSWFPSLKIYNRNGQLYTAVDAELMLAYKESEVGQILHEGINEAGSTASFTAVGTSYSTHNEPMIPLYIFYSMFGFQRTGDGFWAAADQMARGFVLGRQPGAPP